MAQSTSVPSVLEGTYFVQEEIGMHVLCMAPITQWMTFLFSTTDGLHSDDSSAEHMHKPGVALREQDRFLPIANITKIMKKGIPSNGKIAKDARECVQECVSEFISFITSEASERCHLEKRKTINGDDILCAMYTLGFDNYVEPLKLYLTKYRDVRKDVGCVWVQ